MGSDDVLWLCICRRLSAGRTRFIRLSTEPHLTRCEVRLIDRVLVAVLGRKLVDQPLAGKAGELKVGACALDRFGVVVDVQTVNSGRGVLHAELITILR